VGFLNRIIAFSTIVKRLDCNPFFKKRMREFREKLLLKANFKKRPASYFILAATIAIVISLISAPASSISSNQCSSFHGSLYNMQLDIVEGSSQNLIPSSIEVGQTQTVTVIIENVNNSPRHNLFSSVTVTLTSQNSHFSVNTPTYNVGSLPTGTATATWKITGISQGSDVLLISASATNTHEKLQFSDNYSPSSSITVTPNLNPGSTPTPTPTPTDSPSPTTNPTTTNTPTQTQTATPIPTYTKTPTPTSNSHPTVAPTTQPSSNTTLSTPQPGQNSQTTPNPTASPDPLNSPMLYIHPPIAIIGYFFAFLFAILILKDNYFDRKITKMAGIIVWLFTFLGLLTGMLWAQLALGSYWSWNPKEIMTLTLFLTVSVGQLLYFEKKYTATKWLVLISCALVILTGLSSFIRA
jgi:hypothetical protein